MTETPPSFEGIALRARALRDPSLHRHGSGQRNRTEFYKKFGRVADDDVRKTVKEFQEDLGATLVFAGVLSAITSAFTVDIQKKLEPDFQEMSYALLKIIANAALNNNQTNTTFPEWQGPDHTIVLVQSTLYSSLSFSLLAVLIAMMGRQWLDFYASVGSDCPVEHGQTRLDKMTGFEAWHFRWTMKSISVILQLALLLLALGLLLYLLPLGKIVAGTIAIPVLLGLIYVITLLLASMYPGCPFQSPGSAIARWSVEILLQYTRPSSQTIRRVKQSIALPFSRRGAVDGNAANNRAESLTTNTSAEPLPLSNEKINLHYYTLDSRCVGWIVQKPMDADVTMAIAKFIPEIVWHSKTLLTPLETLYDTILECFDYSSGLPVLISELREKAYLSAKALLHATIQHECLGGNSRNVLDSISARYLPLGSIDYAGDWDLESTFGILDRVFGGFESSYEPGPMRWSEFSFTDSHHAWMGYILLHRAVDVIQQGERLPDDVIGFLHHSVGARRLPQLSVVADCLFIAGFSLGIDLHENDLVVVNKSPWIIDQIGKIFERLTEIFENPTPPFFENALLALHVIVSVWRGNRDVSGDLSQRFYRLFHVIAQTPVSPADGQEKVWPAARLALHGAYKLDNFLPPVGDSRNIFTFLGHYLKLATGEDKEETQPVRGLGEPVRRQEESRQDVDEGIRCALRALMDPMPTPATPWSNGDVNLVLDSIGYAFQDPLHSQLSKAALSLLPLMCDWWHNTQSAETTSQVGDWSSASGIGPTDDVQSALLMVVFQMVNSPQLRHRAATMHEWKPLEMVQEYCEPLKRCLRDPDLVDEIVGEKDLDATALWLAVLWLKHGELTPQVQGEVERVTAKAAGGKEGMVFDRCLQIMDSGLEIVRDELRKAEDELKKAGDESGRSGDTSGRARREVDTLRMKIGNLEQTMNSLAEYMNDTDFT